MKRSTLIIVTFTSLLLVSLSIAARPVNAQTRPTISTYAAKFVCGKGEPRIISEGLYFTNINVHNPSPFNRAIYIKRFAIALPDERPGKISQFVVGNLAPDEAMTIDCENIYKHTQVPSGQFLEGFALIYALTELDVVSVYTAGHSEVETVHSERVPVRRLVVPRTNAMAQRLLREQNLQ